MKKELYTTIFEESPEKQHILGVSLTHEQAFALAQDFYRKNGDNVKTEQVFVEKYLLEKTLKIIDNK